MVVLWLLSENFWLIKRRLWLHEDIFRCNHLSYSETHCTLSFINSLFFSVILSCFFFFCMHIQQFWYCCPSLFWLNRSFFLFFYITFYSFLFLLSNTSENGDASAFPWSVVRARQFVHNDPGTPRNLDDSNTSLYTRCRYSIYHWILWSP